VTPEQTRHVLHTAARAEAADDTAPLDEATLLEIRLRPDDVRGWVREEGFALLIEDQVHLCVDPDQRDAGIGTGLLEALLSDVWPRRSLEAWSHADHPAARRLATRHGFEVVRELWVMRRPASEALPDLEVPDGLVIRGFRPEDTEALLALNAAAFADHPEQGQMDAAAFAERCAESWFDPAGLLVAVDTSSAAAPGDESLVGFHWTKVHDRDHGEVYVVAIAPEAQGRGLGRLLTLAGLHHLHDRGVREVLLYVESDNAPAIRVYRDRLGFAHHQRDTHVMYRR
jgi:mycothiol synthase